ncbi:MAG: Serine/threonine-protein kinase PknL [Planctomycetes bacterium]|nr:Serine/threonine-protein kinase PknL [Planctomycetota bacterium]
MRGTRVGPYLVEDELGAGGMGAVWRASGPAGAVALKLVHESSIEGRDAVDRFRREAAIGLRVRHDNVVRTLDVGESMLPNGRVHWIALELIAGRTLQSLLFQHRSLPESLCRTTGAAVARGLAAIHEIGVIHRDVKPENVLVADDGRVKLIDLGVARSIREDMRMTRTGAMVGSVLYASPEQLGVGGRLDGRADLWSLGVLLYECATGVHPFRCGDMHSFLRAVLDDPIPTLRSRCPSATPFFEEIVHVLLARERTRRFETAGELARVLDEGESSPWWSARAPRR